MTDPAIPTTAFTATLLTHPSGLPDSGGYSFLYRAPASWLPEGNHRYRVEFDVTHTDGRVLPVVFYLSTVARFGV